MSIINKTPIIGAMVNDTYEAILEINDLKAKYKNVTDKALYDGEILTIMLDKEVITIDSTQKLINKGKLNFAGAQNILNSFKEGNHD